MSVTETTTGEFFARKAHFGAKMRQEEMQEMATDVAPVKKGGRRERKQESEREGRRDEKREFLHPCKDLVLVHADGLGQG